MPPYRLVCAPVLSFIRLISGQRRRSGRKGRRRTASARLLSFRSQGPGGLHGALCCHLVPDGSNASDLLSTFHLGQAEHFSFSV